MAKVSLSLCFLDAALEFDAGTPLDRPLGGTQSAAAYLSAALAKRGHRVTLVSRLTESRVVQGVDCHPLADLEKGLCRTVSFDCLVFISQFERFAQFGQLFAPGSLRVMWTGDNVDQATIAPLARPEIRSFYERVVCVSQWHRRVFLEKFGAPAERVTAIRNAIGPSFENMFPDAAALLTAKSAAPRLAYTSTPFRGLHLLLQLFPALHHQRPDVELDVYSGLGVYQRPLAQDRYAPLYEQARNTPGVRYVGSIPQRDLAAALWTATILSYPNLFAETSCIAVMEALAAGLRVVTSDLAALPETCMGMATLVPQAANGNDTNRFANDFVRQVLAALDEHRSDPFGFAERAFDQVQTINRTCTWALRAIEWENAIVSWLAARTAG